MQTDSTSYDARISIPGYISETPSETLHLQTLENEKCCVDIITTSSDSVLDIKKIRHVTELEECVHCCCLCLEHTGNIKKYMCSFCKDNPGCYLHENCYIDYTSKGNMYRFKGLCLNCNTGTIADSKHIITKTNESYRQHGLGSILCMIFFVLILSMVIYYLSSSTEL